MYNAKYVIVDGCAIVFSAAIKHSDMVGYSEKAQGAGFVRFESKLDPTYGDTLIFAKAYGRSESLDVESREEDSDIITRQILKK
jgi:hypothetical protein